MSSTMGGQTASQLREEFDASFAKATVFAPETREELLAIRAHESHLAVRARQTAGIMRCPPLTAMPSRNSALCGLAAVRGTLVGVYSIASLIGSTASVSQNGWVVLCADDRSVALLFDELVSYVRVHSKDIHQAETLPGDGSGSEVVQIGAIPRIVISVPSLLNQIHRAARPGKEKE